MEQHETIVLGALNAITRNRNTGTTTALCQLLRSLHPSKSAILVVGTVTEKRDVIDNQRLGPNIVVVAVDQLVKGLEGITPRPMFFDNDAVQLLISMALPKQELEIASDLTYEEKSALLTKQERELKVARITAMQEELDRVSGETPESIEQGMFRGILMAALTEGIEGLTQEIADEDAMSERFAQILDDHFERIGFVECDCEPGECKGREEISSDIPSAQELQDANSSKVGLTPEVERQEQPKITLEEALSVLRPGQSYQMHATTEQALRQLFEQKEV